MVRSARSAGASSEKGRSSFSVLLVGSAEARERMRNVLPAGTTPFQADGESAAVKLRAVVFDLVLASTEIDLLRTIEKTLRETKVASSTARIYFTAAPREPALVGEKTYWFDEQIDQPAVRACIERQLGGGRDPEQP